VVFITIEYKTLDNDTPQIPTSTDQITDISEILYTDNTKLCPECFNRDIEYDDVRDEITCKHCGLLLAAPPHYIAGRIQVDLPWHKTFFNEVSFKTKRFGVISGWIGERPPTYK
jgi:hypothetical protein